MTSRDAACSCGQLRVTCEGDPVRVSICHCLECQKRTGSVFGAQARFPRERVTIAGESNCWSRKGDDGEGATFHFCPTCGSTVYWQLVDDTTQIYVATGAFADPAFPPPQVSVYENRQHPWVGALGDLDIERM